MRVPGSDLFGLIIALYNVGLVEKDQIILDNCFDAVKFMWPSRSVVNANVECSVVSAHRTVELM